ncbi:MAG: LPS export ABC transporter periplasmic protein LptC [Desulfobacterales bacterium]|nr:LPS export ABC transporter periplasmic protein LptC [Desulfobacterales bacterium]
MKTVPARHLFWIIPLTALITSPLWGPPAARFLRPRVSETSVKGAELKSVGKTFVMEDIVFTQCNKGKQQWRLKAASLYTAGSEDDIRLIRVQAEFIGDDHDQRTTISGDRARYQADRQLLSINDKVTVKTANGYEMHTPQLRFQEKKRLLLADNGVTVTGERFQVTGQRLRYYLDSNDVRVEGRVICTVR